MNEQQTAEFLNLYHRASGDDASARIESFIQAYAVFHLAYCLMAANTMNGSGEAIRLRRAADIYRTLLMESKYQNSALTSSLPVVTF
jgi:hypothetical protein